MRITIECSDLKELHEVIENMCVLLPEKKPKIAKREKTESKKEKKEFKPETKPFTVRVSYEELHQKIMELHDQGKKVSEIAKEVGCSMATAYNHLQRG